MSNIVSSGIFCYRNIGKTEKGELGRTPVAIGQAKNVMTYVAKLNNNLGSGTKAAFNVFEKASKTDKLINYAAKGVDFASKHINPLICVSSGIKVLNSDDQASTFIEEAAALKGMFMGEGYMKKNMDEFKNFKGIGKYIQKFEKFCANTKGLKKLPLITKGLAFVGVSMTSYEVGSQFGQLVTNVSGLRKKS